MFGNLSVKNIDQDMAVIASLINENYKSKNLEELMKNNFKSDYSIESCKKLFELILTHSDELRKSRNDFFKGIDQRNNDYFKIVLRAGAYIGEVIRKSNDNYHWYDFENAAKLTKTIDSKQQIMFHQNIVLFNKNKNLVIYPSSEVFVFFNTDSVDEILQFIVNSIG